MTAHTGPLHADTAAGLPAPLDSETATLLRAFLLRHFEQAQSWADLCSRLKSKGFEIAFRSGHLVLIDENDNAVCTGSMIGSPLSELAERLGRPKLRSDCTGATATLKN